MWAGYGKQGIKLEWPKVYVTYQTIYECELYNYSHLANNNNNNNNIILLHCILTVAIIILAIQIMP